jgi:hypothetical protein
LSRRLFRSLAAGQVISRTWLAPRYPPYWHYDILQALVILSRIGKAADPRACDALDETGTAPPARWALAGNRLLVETTRQPDLPGGGGLGPLRTERDDHTQRAARPARRPAAHLTSPQQATDHALRAGPGALPHAAPPNGRRPCHPKWPLGVTPD